MMTQKLENAEVPKQYRVHNLKGILKALYFFRLIVHISLDDQQEKKINELWMS